MSAIQSPDISNALRRALSLDGAGGLPMDAAMTVVPVAVVADVRDEVQNTTRRAWHQARVLAVAGQYSQAMLYWNPAPVGVPSQPRRVFVDRVTVWSASACILYAGLRTGGIAGLPFGSPRYKASAGIVAALPVEVRGGTSATDPITTAPEVCANYRLAPDSPIVIDFKDEPLQLDQPGHVLFFGVDTVNVGLFATFEWREEYRV